MSDPVDLDTMAAEARARIEEDGPYSPTPWQVLATDRACDVGDYTEYHVVDADYVLIAVADSCIDAEMIVVARNILGPILDDRDRLKTEVATLEGILGDLASESYQVQRIRELERRVKVLEEALRPFAEWGDIIIRGNGDMIHDDTMLAITGWIHLYDRPCFGDLRRAAKVLEGRTDASAQ